MDLSDDTNSSTENSSKIPLLIIWLISLGVVSVVAFMLGKGSNGKLQSVPVEQKVLASTPSPTQVVTVQSPVVSVQPDIEEICKKSGFAQKWEYLTSYTVKEGESLTNIVAKELGDTSRTNEVMQLNTGITLVADAVLYLPPASIKKSSGNIKQVYGKLLKKDNASWHISFGGGEKGSGVLLPSYWFSEVADKDAFNIGDCLTILLDDGFKVYSVTKQ